MNNKIDNIILNYSLSNVNLWLIANNNFNFTKQIKQIKQMQKLFLFIFLIAVSFLMKAQPENSKKIGELKLANYTVPTFEDLPKIELPKATIGYKSVFLQKEDNYLNKFTFEKNEKVKSIMVQPDQGYDFNEDRKKALNKIIKEDKTGNQKTQYLGEFSVKSDLIKVMCRDHQEPDGDVVSILVNNKVVVQSITLEGGFKTFYLNLEKGTNYIDFLALNQGLSGPNTAAFVIFDEFGNKIASSQWNLNTGVKASLVMMNKSENSE